MSDDTWDEVAKEADLLKIADAVGVYKSGPVELPDDEAERLRAERIRRARDAAEQVARAAATKGVRAPAPHGGYPGARAWHHRLRRVQALDHALGNHKYPSVHELYRSTDIWQDQADARAHEAAEEQTRQTANQLAAMGLPIDVISNLLRIDPRSTDS